MNVSLTPELENMVNQKVKTGMYNSASEVVREALRLLEEKDRLKEMRLEELRVEIRKGRDQIRSGNYIEVKTNQELTEFGENIIRRNRKRMESQRKPS